MKKLFLLVVIILVPFIVHAQGIGLGIKAGANFSNPSTTNIDISSATNYHFGAYVNLNFSDKFGISPEVLYSVYGSKWNNVSVDFNYLAIPVMLRFKPIKFLSLEAGPQFSFLTKADASIKDQLKSNDFGLAFGAGLHLPLGFNIGARYIYGFSNISDVSDQTINSRTLQLYAGWTIFGAK
jgi:hypothetical protein